MKSNMLRKSGLCLLVAAGAMVPIASSADEGSKYGNQATGTAMESDQAYAYGAFGEGNLYENLQHLQSTKSWTRGERGAQGPIRMESIETAALSAGEGNLYENLQKQQSTKGFSSAERGAQGPIRTEGMDYPTSSESSLYEELRSDH